MSHTVKILLAAVFVPTAIITFGYLLNDDESGMVILFAYSLALVSFFAVLISSAIIQSTQRKAGADKQVSVGGAVFRVLRLFLVIFAVSAALIWVGLNR